MIAPLPGVEAAGVETESLLDGMVTNTNKLLCKMQQITRFGSVKANILQSELHNLVLLELVRLLDLAQHRLLACLLHKVELFNNDLTRLPDKTHLHFSP